MKTDFKVTHRTVFKACATVICLILICAFAKFSYAGTSLLNAFSEVFQEESGSSSKDVSGNFWWDASGDVSGDIIGDVSGDITGDAPSDWISVRNLNEYKHISLSGVEVDCAMSTSQGGTYVTNNGKKDLVIIGKVYDDDKATTSAYTFVKGVKAGSEGYLEIFADLNYRWIKGVKVQRIFVRQDAEHIYVKINFVRQDWGATNSWNPIKIGMTINKGEELPAIENYGDVGIDVRYIVDDVWIGGYSVYRYETTDYRNGWTAPKQLALEKITYERGFPDTLLLYFTSSKDYDSAAQADLDNFKVQLAEQLIDADEFEPLELKYADIKNLDIEGYSESEVIRDLTYSSIVRNYFGKKYNLYYSNVVEASAYLSFEYYSDYEMTKAISYEEDWSKYAGKTIYLDLVYEGHTTTKNVEKEFKIHSKKPYEIKITPVDISEHSAEIERIKEIAANTIASGDTNSQPEATYTVDDLDVINFEINGYSNQYSTDLLLGLYERDNREYLDRLINGTSLSFGVGMEGSAGDLMYSQYGLGLALDLNGIRVFNSLSKHVVEYGTYEDNGEVIEYIASDYYESYYIPNTNSTVHHNYVIYVPEGSTDKAAAASTRLNSYYGQRDWEVIVKELSPSSFAKYLCNEGVADRDLVKAAYITSNGIAMYDDETDATANHFLSMIDTSTDTSRLNPFTTIERDAMKGEEGDTVELEAFTPYLVKMINGKQVISKIYLIGTKPASELKPYDINSVTVDGLEPSYEYTGKDIEPEISIAGLTEGKDYNVYYSNNRNIGTAIVEIEGIGDFRGCMRKTFEIKCPHELIKHEATEATDNTNATKEYYECSICEKYFADSKALEEIKKDSWEIIKEKHIWDDGQLIKEATCTEAGVKAYTCQDCGLARIESIPALGHQIEDVWSVEKEATCTETGIESKLCSKCGYADQSRPVEAVGHTFTDWELVKSPNCTDKGCEQRQCSACGCIETKGVSEKGHNWETAYATDKAPTCTTEGSESIHCKDCEAIKDSRTIEKIAHSWKAGEIVKEATCENAGIQLYQCENCQAMKTEPIEATGHKFGSEWIVDKAASCVENGRESHHCDICGYISDSKAIEATGHSFSTWRTVREPDCVSTGLEQRDCTICGVVEERTIKAEGHSWELRYSEDKNPTCTEEGLESIHCKYCDETKASRTIDALGHSYGAWESVKSPNCIDQGSEQRICEYCGSIETRGVNAKGHNWETEYTVDRAATCTTEGSESIHCMDCDATKDSRTIEKIEHNWRAGAVVKESTCDTEGIQLYQCETCAAMKTEAVAATGHDWAADYTVDKAATCTENGSESVHCNTCGVVKDSRAINATGHNFSAWTNVKTADCTTMGSEERSCSTCGYAETRGVDAKGHNWDAQYTVDQTATCTTEGSESIHCKDCDAVKSSRTIAKIAHNWDAGVVIKDATCDTTGLKLYQCEACSGMKTGIVDATGHSYSKDWTVDRAATCTENGTESHHCTNTGCDSVSDVRVIEAAGHQFSDWENVKSPNCVDQGSEQRVCAICGLTDSRGLAASGHAWESVYTTDKVANCTEDGSESIHCSKCDAVKDSRIIAKTGHDTGDSSVLKAATCVGEGIQIDKCKICGTLTETEIPATGHSYEDAWTVDKAASCTETGIESRHCTQCDAKTDARVIALKNHTLTSHTAVAATCSVAGNSEYYSCSNCGAFFEDESSSKPIAEGSWIIKATGHEFAKEWTTDVEATCTDGGSKSHHCIHKDCNAVKDETEIEPLGHNYSEEWTVDKEASTTEEGSKSHHCTRCGDKANVTAIARTENIIRISGASRFDTAIESSNKLGDLQGNSSYQSIIVASGTNFPDALTGSYLAKVKNAPIVLVDSSSESKVASYIKSKLQSGGTIYILGGYGAVSSKFESKVSGIGTVRRLAGSNRFSTNIEILKAAGVSNEDILICTGSGYADSLSASAAGKPILLVGDTLTQEQKDYLKTLGTTKAYTIGGKGVVSDSIAAEYKSITGIAPKRVAGTNRYATSVAVAREFFGTNCSTVAFSYAMNFPDGLSGGPVAMNLGAPLILVSNDAYSDAKAYCKSVRAKQAYVFGGSALISNSIIEAMLVS